MAFKFAPLIPYETAESARLGVSTSTKLNDNDVGKPVTLSADRFVVAGDGEEIYGFVSSIEPFTVDGYSFGGVIREGRFYAKVVAAGTTLVAGDFVVAAAQAAVNTAQDYPVIKKAPNKVWTDAGEGEKDVTLPDVLGKHAWRVLSLLGDGGEAGDVVLIERI